MLVDPAGTTGPLGRPELGDLAAERRRPGQRQRQPPRPGPARGFPAPRLRRPRPRLHPALARRGPARRPARAARAPTSPSGSTSARPTAGSRPAACAWIPLPPPVLLEQWEQAPDPAFDRFTTVGTWRNPLGTLEAGGHDLHAQAPPAAPLRRRAAAVGPALRDRAGDPSRRGCRGGERWRSSGWSGGRGGLGRERPRRLPRVRPRLGRRVLGRPGRLRRSPHRLGQRPHRPLPRQRPARGGPGDRDPGAISSRGGDADLRRARRGGRGGRGGRRLLRPPLARRAGLSPPAPSTPTASSPGCWKRCCEDPRQRHGRRRARPGRRRLGGAPVRARAAAARARGRPGRAGRADRAWPSLAYLEAVAAELRARPCRPRRRRR